MGQQLTLWLRQALAEHAMSHFQPNPEHRHLVKQVKEVS